jgi:dedicated sortase system histidine kinase
MRISLRLKLAFLSLLLLLFPLLGLRLNTLLKNSLITSQKETLAFTARAVATALGNRGDLFAREQFHSLDRKKDLYLFQLSSVMRLDGLLDDWQPEYVQAKNFGAKRVQDGKHKKLSPSVSFRHLTGKQGIYLYAFFEVTDDAVVYRSKKSLHLDRSDHLQIVVEGDGWQRKYLVTSYASGWVNGFLMPSNPGRFPVVAPDVQGVWRETDRGYILELRMPLTLTGKRLAFTIVDVDDSATGRIIARVGTADLTRNQDPGWLLATSKAIEKILSTLDLPAARIRVVDSNHHVRAQVGSLRTVSPAVYSENRFMEHFIASLHELMQPLYRFFITSFSSEIPADAPQPTALDIQGITEGLAGKSSLASYLIKDGTVKVMAAITPLKDGDSTIGAVVVEQTTNSILALSNRLIEEILLLSVLAFLVGGGALLLFAFRISARIRRLRNQAASSITVDGRVHNDINPGNSRDEIGDLGQTLHSMLTQLKLQVEHRENMADNLEHEMRTPLAGIAASLKNLSRELENPSGTIQKYLDWAGRDVVRLEKLLTSIREATTLQEALQQEAQEVFDLGRALSLWIAHGWQQTRPDICFECSIPKSPVPVLGDPVRLRQAMDKLVDNAISFHALGTPVQISLQWQASQAILRVINRGSSIDPALQHQIFNSMVSSRKNKGALPHLGLGLYIVRTIITHHRGRVECVNLMGDDTGVCFTVILPAADNRGSSQTSGRATSVKHVY